MIARKKNKRNTVSWSKNSKNEEKMVRKIWSFATVKSSNCSPFDQIPSFSGDDSTTCSSSRRSNCLKNINFLLFNSRSLVNKLSFLKILLCTNNFDFVFVTETWLKSCYTNSFITNISGYEIMRCDRSKERGGGVAVLYSREVSNKISVIEANVRDSDPFELLALDYHYSSNMSARFVCLYLSPDNAKNVDVVVSLLKILQKLYTANNFYVLGDFNFSSIDWKNPHLSLQKPCAKKFINFLNNNNLSQLVSSPTHELGNVLDLILTSSPTNVLNVNVREPFTQSCDHFMVEASLNLPISSGNSTKEKRNFHRANYPDINSFLSSFHWKSIIHGADSLDDAYCKVISIIHQSIVKYVPIGKVKSKFNTPKQMRSLLALKKKYYGQSKTNPKAKELYKECAKKYKTSVSEFFKNQERHIATANDKNTLFKYVKRRLRTSNGIPPLIDDKGKLIFEPTDKANAFNNSFAKVFLSDNGTQPTLSNLSSSAFSSMPLFHIRPSDVRTAIQSLKNSVSRTPEDVPAIFLKRTQDSLIYALSELFNLSISRGQLPPSWKSAIVVPIYKKGLSSEPLNYRPISLTSVICRILEKIIHKKIYEHLTRHSLLSRDQHGFLKKRSTLT